MMRSVFMSVHSEATGPAQLILDRERRAAKIVLHAAAVDVQVVEPLDRLLAQAGGARLEHFELDLSNVSFADSAVVRLALKARDFIEPAGGRVVIRAPAEVRRLFELTKTDGLFAIVPA
jgi:anti-anti-sigma factor